MTEATYNTKSLNPKFIWAGLIAVILIGGTWLGLSNLNTPINTTEYTSATDLEAAPIPGHPAPDFRLKNLDGQTVSLSNFRGQPVILNFWATWCGPCRVEMPEFQAAYTAYEDQGVVVLGINLTQRDSLNAVPGFLEEFGLTFPVVLDEKGEVADIYKVFGQPASIFIDKDGLVHEVFYGPVNKAYIDARIAELLIS